MSQLPMINLSSDAFEVLKAIVSQQQPGVSNFPNCPISRAEISAYVAVYGVDDVHVMTALVELVAYNILVSEPDGRYKKSTHFASAKTRAMDALMLHVHNGLPPAPGDPDYVWYSRMVTLRPR